MLLHDFVNDQIEDFLSLSLKWYLTLIDHIKTTLFVNEQGTRQQYKTTNKLNIFFTNKGAETIWKIKQIENKIIKNKN